MCSQFLMLCLRTQENLPFESQTAVIKPFSPPEISFLLILLENGGSQFVWTCLPISLEKWSRYGDRLRWQNFRQTPCLSAEVSQLQQVTESSKRRFSPRQVSLVVRLDSTTNHGKVVKAQWIYYHFIARWNIRVLVKTWVRGNFLNHCFSSVQNT